MIKGYRKKLTGFGFGAGFYPGILLGIRSYNYTLRTEHVLYLPIFLELVFFTTYKMVEDD